MRELNKKTNLAKFLAALGSDEWWYVASNDTLYTDLNETFTSDNLAAEILRNIDQEIMIDVDNILGMGLPRTQEVEAVLKLLEGCHVSKVVNATYETIGKVDLLPEIKRLLPYIHQTRIAFFTGILQISADIYIENKICPLYYQKVPHGNRIGHIAIVGTIHKEEDGILTGKASYIPDDMDRVILSSVDVLTSLGYENELDELKNMANYPYKSKGLVYTF